MVTDTAGEAERTDLVLTNGQTFDPETGEFGQFDISVRGSKIGEIGRPLQATRADEVDCSGCYVVPGLIDCHVHVLPYASRVGVPPDQAHLRRGTVAVADAGTAGAATFEALKRLVVDVSETRVLCMLNVSLAGVVDWSIGELRQEAALSVPSALAVARAYPDIVRGFKIRLSTEMTGGSCLSYLEKSLDLAGQAGLPLMVHIGDTADPLSEILQRLRPGDVVSHCYTGKANGLLDESKRVIDDAWDARSRGVLFDSAHGKTNLSFDVARHAIEQGFSPDLISSDLTRRNWAGPVYDLVTTMSKFLVLGLSFAQILERVTWHPARMLKLDAEGFGTIRAGNPANLTVLRIGEGVREYEDGSSSRLSGREIVPTAIVRNGRLYTPFEATEPARLEF